MPKNKLFFLYISIGIDSLIWLPEDVIHQNGVY